MDFGRVSAIVAFITSVEETIFSVVTLSTMFSGALSKLSSLPEFNSIVLFVVSSFDNEDSGLVAFMNGRRLLGFVRWFPKPLDLWLVLLLMESFEAGVVRERLELKLLPNLFLVAVLDGSGDSVLSLEFSPGVTDDSLGV